MSRIETEYKPTSMALNITCLVVAMLCPIAEIFVPVLLRGPFIGPLEWAIAGALFIGVQPLLGLILGAWFAKRSRHPRLRSAAKFYAAGSLLGLVLLIGCFSI